MEYRPLTTNMWIAAFGCGCIIWCSFRVALLCCAPHQMCPYIAFQRWCECCWALWMRFANSVQPSSLQKRPLLERISIRIIKAVIFFSKFKIWTTLKCPVCILCLLKKAKAHQHWQIVRYGFEWANISSLLASIRWWVALSERRLRVTDTAVRDDAWQVCSLSTLTNECRLLDSQTIPCATCPDFLFAMIGLFLRYTASVCLGKMPQNFSLTKMRTLEKNFCAEHPSLLSSWFSTGDNKLEG